MISTRFSNDEDLESNKNYFFDLSHLNSFDNMAGRYSNSKNTAFSSPYTDAEDRKSSCSVPISPIHPNHQHQQHYDRRESAEIAQMEFEFQFKTLEMLALIKGTTPKEAYLAERLEEIRSQNSRSCDVDDNDDVESVDHDHSTIRPHSSYEEDNEYLIGDSFVDDEQFEKNIQPEASYDSDEEEDIFGMEL